MSDWLEWYEGKFEEMSGEDEPLHTMGRALFYASFATWTAPILACMFLLQEALEDFLGALFPWAVSDSDRTEPRGEQ